MDWSEEIFVIKKIKNIVPWTHIINDLNGEEIVGTFYEKELQGTNQQDLYNQLLLEAQKYVKNVGEVQFVYADVNCNLKVKFRNNNESFFTSMQELEDLLDK